MPPWVEYRASDPQMPQARTFSRTSVGPVVGRSTSTQEFVAGAVTWTDLMVLLGLRRGV
jgi:hypothetical protein